MPMRAPLVLACAALLLAGCNAPAPQRDAAMQREGSAGAPDHGAYACGVLGHWRDRALHDVLARHESARHEHARAPLPVSGGDWVRITARWSEADGERFVQLARDDAGHVELAILLPREADAQALEDAIDAFAARLAMGPPDELRRAKALLHERRAPAGGVVEQGTPRFTTDSAEAPFEGSGDARGLSLREDAAASVPGRRSFDAHDPPTKWRAEAEIDIVRVRAEADGLATTLEVDRDGRAMATGDPAALAPRERVARALQSIGGDATLPGWEDAAPACR